MAALQGRIGNAAVLQMVTAKPGAPAVGGTGLRMSPRAPVPALVLAPVGPAAKASVGPARAPGAAAPPAKGGPATARDDPGAAHAKQPEAGDAAEAKAAKPGAAGKAGGEAAKGPADAAAPDADAGKAGAEGGAPAVQLHIPEPPTRPSPATMRRISGVKARAGGKAAAQGALPSAETQVGGARQAVTPPDAERAAAAQAALIAQVHAAPSPEIVALCERIRTVIREKRPPDEDALAAAKPDAAATDAGNQLNSTVQGETKKVQDNYGAVNAKPATPGAPTVPGVPPQPAAAGTAPVNATAAKPDAVPAENVSLDKDVADAKKKTADAGMETEPAKLVQSGPVAEARDASGELEQTAKEDPAKVLAKQKEALGAAEADMAALQMQALTALTVSREGAVKGAGSRQTAMVGSEEQMRAKAGAEAKKVFDDAQTAVNALLKDLPSKAMDQWEAAKEILVSKFKADLAIVQQRVDDRHSGASGFVVGLWDAVTGLPSWAEEAYTRAETNFGDGVIEKLTKISTEVNAVIAACDLIIKGARDRIAQIFKELPASLQGWADGEQAKFDHQLDNLHNQVIAARDSFNKDLVERSSAAVDEVRAEIAELRKKAGGLIGRIASAIARFIDDPVKFIIEGLLELLGIPPAAFWAVVAKIKKCVKDIASDPLGFADNLLKGLGQGFSQFFDNFGEHMIRGFLTWLLGDLKGVQIPKDVSLRSIITFFLQLMGITWPNIRKILVDKIGPKNVALIEKVYSLVSLLIEKGPEGIYEMIKDKLDPQSIVDQVVDMAVDFMVTAIAKQVAARLLLLFNPAGAIAQALEAIYRVLKWIFLNAARIFTLVETVVNGIADIIAGNVGGFANAVEKGLAMLIAPVLGFIADYFSLGDLPSIVADKIKSMQKWILGLIEKAIVWIIEKGKALLEAIGIGKKDKEKKGEEGGTAHEQAVRDVAATLAQPPAGDPLSYEVLRAVKEKEAMSLAAARNSVLADEKVKMTVVFADPAKDKADHDIDFKVRIAPNDSEAVGAVPAPVAEPVAGVHVVQRPPPFQSVGGESHHVPAKGLGSGIARFLNGVASGLRGGEWKSDPAAEAVADAFATRAAENAAAAEPPAVGLSAIMLCPEAHTEAGGVHTVEGSGPVLIDIASNPVGRAIVAVKRRTESKILGVASYLAVNPQIRSWELYVADIRRALSDPNFRNEHHMPPGTQTAVEMILVEAEKEMQDAGESAHEFLHDRVVKRTNAILDRAVGDAYKTGKSTVAAAMDRANDGTPEGRKLALNSLDGHFGSTWRQFRQPIDYP